MIYYDCIVLSNFKVTKYSFQNLSLGLILKIFLKFRKFQPRYSPKISSYKKRVYLALAATSSCWWMWHLLNSSNSIRAAIKGENKTLNCFLLRGSLCGLQCIFSQKRKEKKTPWTRKIHILIYMGECICVCQLNVLF